MSNEKLILMYVTAPSFEEAKLISSELVKKRLVACANIISGMKSIYSWEDKLEMSDEVLIVLKTREEKAALVEKMVEAMHSYKVPCILRLAIEGGNSAYLEWLDQSID